MDIISDKLKDECGVVGIHRRGKNTIAKQLYSGLLTLQHRGQESAGIAVLDQDKMHYHKAMGLVSEVFNEGNISKLTGDVGIGHVRYSTTGESYVKNAQPLVVEYKNGYISLAHNGNLVNATEIRSKLEDAGSIFQTTIDSEVIANLIARNYSYGLKEAVVKTAEAIKGSFALVMVIDGKLVGIRDKDAIRPLALGKFKDGYCLASESVVFDIVGAEFVRDIEPGEIVIIDDDGIESIRYAKNCKKSICSFEYVYFARPDSTIDGINVYQSRFNAGEILAHEYPVEADLVIAVPDSGIAGAIGYSHASGIPYGNGLIKNKYVGRTFIKPDQEARELAVRMKLNVLKNNVAGKRIVMVDDSIVRGTTSRRIVKMLKDAGAKEVHVRVTSPPVKYSCYFGIDTPSKKELIGATHGIDEICKTIGADSLGYVSVSGLVKAIELSENHLCTACFSGKYPMEVPKKNSKYIFEKQ